MKKITLRLSEDSVPSEVVGEFKKQLPVSTKRSPEFQIVYNQVVACIEDFTSKAKKVAHAGTTIHLKREINFNNFSALIILDSPRSTSIFNKIKKLLGRN